MNFHWILLWIKIEFVFSFSIPKTNFFTQIPSFATFPLAFFPPSCKIEQKNLHSHYSDACKCVNKGIFISHHSSIINSAVIKMFLFSLKVSIQLTLHSHHLEPSIRWSATMVMDWKSIKNSSHRLRTAINNIVIDCVTRYHRTSLILHRSSIFVFFCVVPRCSFFCVCCCSTIHRESFTISSLKYHAHYYNLSSLFFFVILLFTILFKSKSISSKSWRH